MNILKDYRRKIDSSKIRLELKKQDLEKCEKTLNLARLNLEDHISVREVFKQAALCTQNYLEVHLSNIVSKAIQAVFFEKNIQFRVEFIERRNSSECDMYVIEDGYEFDLLDDRGHGMADIASMALRVAYILLDNIDNVMVLDEPFRNLDKDRQPYASKMIKELSRELNMQFIIATHIPYLIDYADRHIITSIKNKVSSIK